MTRQKSVKRLVRSRMDKTGESYTAARAVVLTARPEAAGTEPAPLVTSDESIRLRTGRGWEEWFALLDEWHADERPHREIARWVARELGIDPLAWAAQAVTMSYERARVGRVVGQRTSGFAITASKTVAVPVGRLYEAFSDASRRTSWLSEHRLRERTATKPKSMRFAWEEGRTRVNVGFAAKDAGRATVSLEHARLSDATEAAVMKVFWRERLSALKSWLEQEPLASG